MRLFDERYVLRLWQEAAKESHTRASLTKLHGGETRYFSDMPSLIKHIREFDRERQSSRNDCGKPPLFCICGLELAAK